MPAASDKGSQPYSRAYGYGEMAGKDEPHTRNLADMQGTRANHVAYRKGRLILLGEPLPQPFRNTQGRFCMAGYHCLMPTAFLPLQRNITHFTSNDISFIDNIRSNNNIAYGVKAKITKKAEPQARDSAFILFLLKNYLVGTNVI